MNLRLTLCAVLLVTGCATTPLPQTSPNTSPSSTPSRSETNTTKPLTTVSTASAKPPKAESTARRKLSELTVTNRPKPVSDYSRREFGSSWRDTDGNGCNQRDDVLLRDAVAGSTKVQRQGACDHDVLAGTWIDPYNGQTLSFDDLKNLSQAQGIQIDHVVPLAEAWSSGAAAWPRERRIQFANDLSVLRAAGGRTNASKGASDPAAWRPKKAYQCGYAMKWIEIKHRWELTVDRSEVAALESMLDTCIAKAP